MQFILQHSGDVAGSLPLGDQSGSSVENCLDFHDGSVGNSKEKALKVNSR